KFPHAFHALLWRKWQRPVIQLLQIGSCAETTRTSARDNASTADGCEIIKNGYKLFQLFQQQEADLIDWLPIQRHLDHAFSPLPPQGFSAKLFHRLNSVLRSV